MNDFDLKAKDWDKNPINVERAKAISEAVRKNIGISGNMKGFEFGSGTGLLSFNLADSLKEITLSDSSKGMIDVVNEKIKNGRITNMKTSFSNLENDDIPSEKFDIILTQMTLHHIADINMIIRKFFMMLNNSGYIAIADLYKEDGSFHGKDFGGHNGFDPESLKNILQDRGFVSVRYSECYKMKRLVDGNERTFPLFLLTGQKP
jgi:2-polyprenyl-3-methyl-5-hydroxy-6-metoxy-1,4-benzoquinol methylase